MREVFRISVADSVTLVNKLKKFSAEDWSEQYSDEIFDKMYSVGYDLSESVDYDITDDSIKFYFLTDSHVKVCDIEESERRYPMRADEMFIGSNEFLDKAEESGFRDIFTFGSPIEIVSVTHDDRVTNTVIYDLRKLTTDGGKHETVELTDEFIIECIKKDGEGDDELVLGERELSGQMVMEIPDDDEEE